MEVIVVFVIGIAIFLLVEFVLIPLSEIRDMRRAIAEVEASRGDVPPWIKGYQPRSCPIGGKVPPKPAPMRYGTGNVPPAEFPRHPPPDF